MKKSNNLAKEISCSGISKVSGSAVKMMKGKACFEDFYLNEDPWSEYKRIKRFPYKYILSHFLSPSATTLLAEVGCGEGAHFYELFRGLRQKKYLGIDISNLAVSRASNKAKELKLDLSNVTFRTGTFDLICKLIEKSKCNTIEIVILETLYYLNDDEIHLFFKAIEGVALKGKKISIVVSSLNVEELKGREYITLKKLSFLIEKHKIDLTKYFPISWSKRSLMYPVWLLCSVLRFWSVPQIAGYLSRFHSARNLIYRLEVRG